jgi:hypothetical protein
MTPRFSGNPKYPLKDFSKTPRTPPPPGFPKKTKLNCIVVHLSFNVSFSDRIDPPFFYLLSPFCVSFHQKRNSLIRVQQAFFREISFVAEFTPQWRDERASIPMMRENFHCIFESNGKKLLICHCSKNVKRPNSK